MAEDGFSLDLDIEGFREWTEAVIRELDREGARTYLRKVALEFIRRVIGKTPVDFGRARAGWASFAIKMGQSPRLGGTRKRREGISQAVGVGQSGTQAQLEGLAEGSFNESFRGDDKFIEIINGVSYIVFLEFGSSDQAPGGMMRITFKEMKLGHIMTEELAKQLERTYKQINRRMRKQRLSARGKGFGALSGAGV